MAANGIGDSKRSREDHLTESDEKPKLRLKNGSVVDARKAYVLWQRIETIEDRKPQTLEMLVALAKGEGGKIPAEALQHLREEYLDWFTPDGTLEPVFRDVVLSAHRDTLDGPVVVNPFQIITEGDVRLLASVRRQANAALRKLFGDDDAPGYSPTR